MCVHASLIRGAHVIYICIRRVVVASEKNNTLAASQSAGHGFGVGSNARAVAINNSVILFVT